MKFTEALELLKSGKNVVRECWVDTDGYLTFLEGMKHVWKIITVPGPNAGNHIFNMEEMTAEDWQLSGWTPALTVNDEIAQEAVAV